MKSAEAIWKSKWDFYYSEICAIIGWPSVWVFAQSSAYAVFIFGIRLIKAFRIPLAIFFSCRLSGHFIHQVLRGLLRHKLSPGMNCRRWPFVPVLYCRPSPVADLPPPEDLQWCWKTIADLPPLQSFPHIISTVIGFIFTYS